MVRCAAKCLARHAPIRWRSRSSTAWPLAVLPRSVKWLLVCPTVFNEAVVHRGTEQETPIDMHLINPSNIYDRFATRVFGRGMSEVRPRRLDQAAITASSDLACRVPAECRQVRQAAPGTAASRETYGLVRRARAERDASEVPLRTGDAMRTRIRLNRSTAFGLCAALAVAFAVPVIANVDSGIFTTTIDGTKV